MENDRIAALEERVGLLERRQHKDRIELGANSRATLVFFAGLVVLLLIGIKYSGGEFQFEVPLATVAQIFGLPAAAAIVSALIPGRRNEDQ